MELDFFLNCLDFWGGIKLTKNGFKILATTTPIAGHKVLNITNDELQSTNTYMAVINVNVGAKEVRVQKPFLPWCRLSWR